MTKNWARMLGILLLLLILPIVNLAQRADAQEGGGTPVVRLSFSSGWDALPALIAIERGFFAQQGVIVSGLAITSGEAVIGSLVSGSTDVALLPQRTFLIMAAAKFPVKAIAVGGWGTEVELIAPAGSKAKSLADFKGKTIAITRGSEAFPVLIRLINQQKFKVTDFKIVQMSGGELTQIFTQKKADAIFETRHFTTSVASATKAITIIKSADIAKAVGSVNARPLVVGNKMIETDSATVQKIVNAWVGAQQYIQQDPEDAARVLRIFFHRQGVAVSPALAKAWVSYTKFDQFAWTKAAVTDAEYNGWGLKTGKILKVEPKLTGFIENKFVEAATKGAAAPAKKTK